MELEKKLKKEEIDLLSKKADMNKEEYIKKTDELRKKVIDYQSQRRTSLDKLAKQRADARKKLFEKGGRNLFNIEDRNYLKGR